MKKMLAIFLVLSLVILTASAALADDLSALSDAELDALYQEVLNEQLRREAESYEETFAPAQAYTDETHPALQPLVLFFQHWNRNQHDEMLELCLPEWKEQCEDPRMELFRILANRTPVTLEILKTEPGDPEDSVLTVTVISELDRNNGTAAEKYRLQIRMEKSADGFWYVDPECLLNCERAEYLPETGPTPDPVPDGQIPADDAAPEPSEGDPFRQPATEEDNLVVRRMAEFFGEWGENDLDGMVAYCMPEWQAKQEFANTKLFALLRNRTPLSMKIEGITPAEPEDSFRRVLVDTEMDQHNGKDPARYLLVIWMVRSGDGLWYVDPGCLENPDNLDLVTQAEPTPDPDHSQVPFDNMLLYYNPTGGEYYHADPNCKSVNPKFQPLAGSFEFSEINDEPYCHLKRCNVCGAPFRP